MGMTREKAIKFLELDKEQRGKCFISDAIDVAIKTLKQEQKTGHWINKYHLFDSCSAECSSCHKRSNGYMHDNGFSLECKYYDFCPECGARMIEPQESEEQTDD